MIRLVIIFSILFVISYSQLPAVGQFIFTSYYDSKCASPILNAVGIYNSTNECWPISSNQSINPKFFFTSSNLLTYYTCLYINLNVSQNFTISSYTDNKCSSNSIGSAIYSAKNLCWVTSVNSSMLPINLNSNSNSLSVITFGNPYCVGGSLTVSGANLQCDGTCTQSGLISGTYYSCRNSASICFTYSLSIFSILLYFFLF